MCNNVVAHYSFSLKGYGYCCAVPIVLGLFVGSCLEKITEQYEKEQIDVGTPPRKTKVIVYHKSIEDSPDSFSGILYTKTEIPVGGVPLLFQNNKSLSNCNYRNYRIFLYQNMDHPIKRGVVKREEILTIGKNRIKILEGTDCVFYKNGNIKSVFRNPARGCSKHYAIDMPNEIDGMHTQIVYDGGISFYEDGSVESFISYNGCSVPIGKNENNTLQYLKSLKNRIIYYYPNGSLRKIFCANPVLIKTKKQDLLFNGGSIPRRFCNYIPMNGYPISFYEDGSVQSGYLAEKKYFTIDDASICFAPTLIEFYSSGDVKSGTIAQSEVITGPNNIALSSKVMFYPNGKIQFGITTCNVELMLGKQKYQLPQKSEIMFNDDETISAMMSSGYPLIIPYLSWVFD